MNDECIAALKAAVAASKDVRWMPDDGTCRKVRSVGAPPPPDLDDEPEPGECAYLSGGRYAALYNCDLDDFRVVVPLEVT